MRGRPQSQVPTGSPELSIAAILALSKYLSRTESGEVSPPPGTSGWRVVIKDYPGSFGRYKPSGFLPQELNY